MHITKRPWFLALAIGTLGLGACSESKDSSGSGGSGGSSAAGGSSGASGGSAGSGATGGSSGSGGSAGTGGGGAGGSSGASGSAGSSTGGAGGAGGFAACGLSENASSTLVVNEISSQGQDWIELVNTGSAPVDIGGVVVADFDPATGCPKTTEALTFPAGASITAGEHLLIVADQPGAPNTPQTSCLGGPPSCYHVGFGISGGSGDQIFFLSGTSIEAHGEIPANAVVDGETWCRIPDATGSFVKCQPTPGATNAAL
jgi:hypothetical protein